MNGPLYNYIWDYSSDLPTAAIINATANDFAYTSFESTSAGNWSYAGTPALDGTTPFGKYSYSLSSGAISATNLIAANTYNLSYWTNNTSPYTIAGTAGGYPVQERSYNGWTNYLHQVSGVTGVSISGSGSIDDVHLYPANGQMSTYIYDPLIGMTVSTDTKGNTNYYDYDQDERLMDARDLNGNIVKAYAYNFAGWPNGTPLGNYANLAESGTFTNNSCGPGYTGSGPVTYTVPANTYFSNISQADANGKAIGDVTANGQNYANANSSCVLAPCVQPTVYPVQTTAGGPVTITTNVVSAGPTYQILTVSSGGSQVGQPIPITSLTTSLALSTAPLNLAAGNTYTFTLTTSGPACNLASTPATITLH